MLDKFRRHLLRKRLKKEKRNLLLDFIEIKRKLKILDELDELDKKQEDNK